MMKKKHEDSPEDIEAFAAYKRGEIKPVRNSQLLVASARTAAANFRKKKEARINIRLTGGDLDDLKARAEEEGLPYQTFIASVLHKYLNGRL